ncbi:toprim domain-containing protein [Pseudovibrio sp. POLY-S9]|uniref:DUF7146 domain-containing protein n=1 Tax=Pseudovibrio sp. POLY-S9 TaxID=1576596 RepID=UPI00070B60CA|nr:toprim domain-containing protein [Pseudovibrio sp. POLY-S9]
MNRNPDTQAWIDEAKDVPLDVAAEMTSAAFKRTGSEFTSISGCPACGGRDRLGFNTAKKVWICRGADQGHDAIGFLMHVNSLSFLEAVEALTGRPNPSGQKSKPLTQEQRDAIERKRAAAKAKAEAAEAEQAEKVEDTKAYSLKLWKEGRSIAGTPAETYLLNRGIPKLDWPTCLRFHKGLKHQSGKTYPALIAQVVDVDGAHMAIWRIFLTRDGQKAPEQYVKLGLAPISGGAVRLAAPSGGRIALTEGIETGLAVMVLTGLPVWPVLARAGFKNLELPEGVERVDNYADHDKPKWSEKHGCFMPPEGLRDAEEGAARFRSMGVEAHVHKPEARGNDWLDVLNKVQQRAA